MSSNINLITRRNIASLFLCAAIAGLTAGSASAAINLELRTSDTSVLIGQPVDVELWFVSDEAGGTEYILADVNMAWDETFLTYDKRSDVVIGTTGIQPDPPSNEMVWSVAAPLGDVLVADPNPGTLVTTLTFIAQAETAGTIVEILALGQTETVLMNGEWTPVTGTDLLPSPSIEILVPEPMTSLLFVLAGLFAAKRRRPIL